MKRLKFALLIIGSCLLSPFNPMAFSADSRASEVEAVISTYFKEFHAKNLQGMVAVSTPGITIVDYGQSFDLDEWNWYMTFSFKEMVPYDVKLTNFKTKIAGDTAYTFFRMSGGEPNTPEIANAVLKRSNGKWRIDFIQIEKEQKWLSWLHDRINKGQDVSNWYEEYSKENP